MFGWLRTAWYWLVAEKVPPNGHPRDIDVRNLAGAVDRLRTDLGTLGEVVVRHDARLADHIERILEVEKHELRIKDHAARIESAEDRLDALTRAVEQRDARLGEVARDLGGRLDDLRKRVLDDWMHHGGEIEAVDASVRGAHARLDALEQQPPADDRINHYLRGPIAEMSKRLTDFEARLDALEKRQPAPACKTCGGTGQVEKGNPATAGYYVACPDCTHPRPAELTPDEEAKAARLAGYCPEPCPFCGQRKVVSAPNGYRRCDHCDGKSRVSVLPGFPSGAPAKPKCSKCGDKGTFVVGGDYDGPIRWPCDCLVAPSPPTPEDEAARLYDCLLAHPAPHPSRDGWVAACAAELRRFLDAHRGRG